MWEVKTANLIETRKESRRRNLSTNMSGKSRATSSDIRLYPPANYWGIFVLQIKPHNIDAVHRMLASALAYFTQDSIRQALLIIDHNKFRERR